MSEEANALANSIDKARAWDAVVARSDAREFAALVGFDAMRLMLGMPTQNFTPAEVAKIITARALPEGERP